MTSRNSRYWRGNRATLEQMREADQTRRQPSSAASVVATA
jgi:hypothetical protein